MKARQEAEAAKKKEVPSTRFWDGFQWVDRIAMDPVAAVASTGGVGGLPPIATGNQKDRRVYVGNLPPGTTPEQLKEFSK